MLLSIQPMSNVLLWAAGVATFLIIVYNTFAIWIAAKNVFKGSGAPISMAQAVINSIQSTSQFLFGVFIVTILFVLITEKTITSEVGIPVVTSVIGFLLGRTITVPESRKSKAGGNRPQVAAS